ncbi:MAG: META domain-containing protein [Bacteroidota bacterium]
MKHLITYLLFAGMLFTQQNAFAQTGKKEVTEPAMIAGDWFLQPVLPSDTAAGHIPAISFDLAKKKFKGFTGCNNMSGSFIVSGDALSFDKDITTTKVVCEGFNEKEFIANLLRVDHYQIKEGILILLIDKTPISKWMRKNQRILAPSP